jgi:hypothetical protein
MTRFELFFFISAIAVLAATSMAITCGTAQAVTPQAATAAAVLAADGQACNDLKSGDSLSGCVIEQNYNGAVCSIKIAEGYYAVRSGNKLILADSALSGVPACALSVEDWSKIAGAVGTVLGQYINPPSVQ